jgi:hypothetical protein
MDEVAIERVQYRVDFKQFQHDLAHSHEGKRRILRLVEAADQFLSARLQRVV